MSDLEFGDLLLEMQPCLRGIAKQYLHCHWDQQDAVQECLCKVWQKRDSLRYAQYAKTWIVRVLINECIDILRKKRRLEEFEQEQFGDKDEFQLLIERADLQQAFEQISEQDQRILRMHYYKGYHVREVADAMKIPMSTVQSRLYRSLKKLSCHLMVS